MAGVWAAEVSEDAKARARFERKLSLRPLDRGTLSKYSDFLYDRGLYEEAVTVYETSLRAGNDGRRLRLRLARSQLALHRIHLRHAHRRHPPPTLLQPPLPTANVSPGSELTSSASAAAVSTTTSGSGGGGAAASEGFDGDDTAPEETLQHHLPLLALQAPSPVPLVAAAEVSRRHLGHARRHMAEVLTYSAVIRHHPLTLFEAATVEWQCNRPRRALALLSAHAAFFPPPPVPKARSAHGLFGSGHRRTSLTDTSHHDHPTATVTSSNRYNVNSSGHSTGAQAPNTGLHGAASAAGAAATKATYAAAAAIAAQEAHDLAGRVRWLAAQLAVRTGNDAQALMWYTQLVHDPPPLTPLAARSTRRKHSGGAAVHKTEPPKTDKTGKSGKFTAAALGSGLNAARAVASAASADDSASTPIGPSLEPDKAELRRLASMADAKEDANDGDGYDHYSEPNTPRDGDETDGGGAVRGVAASAARLPLDDNPDSINDDDDDAAPLAPPPPSHWSLWCELGRCHERLGQRACAARVALAAVAEARGLVEQAQLEQRAKQRERAALWAEAQELRQQSVDAAAAVSAAEAAAAASPSGGFSVDGGLYGSGSVLGASSKGKSSGSKGNDKDNQAAMSASVGGAAKKQSGDGDDNQSILSADNNSLVSALTAPTVKATAAASAREGDAAGAAISPDDAGGNGEGRGGEGADEGGEGNGSQSAEEIMAQLDLAASQAAQAWELAEAKAWAADGPSQHEADAQAVRDALDHLAEVVAENAKGEDADAATAALLSAEAHYHNDTVIAAAVGHGGPFPGFGIPHGGGGGWKRWHSSGRTHHATVAGGVSGRGAQGATAGCLGGDEAAGWGTRAALKEKFDVCAAQFPEGHGELTKAAFKALVDEMMRENDSDVPPSDKDMDVAFTLADADMSGLVDFDEFAKLYKLIKVGEVRGLGRRSVFSTKRKNFVGHLNNSGSGNGEPSSGGNTGDGGAVAAEGISEKVEKKWVDPELAAVVLHREMPHLPTKRHKHHENANSHRNSAVAAPTRHHHEHDVNDELREHGGTQAGQNNLHDHHNDQDDFGANCTDEEADAASIAAMEAWGLKDASSAASYEPEFKASLSGLSGAHGEGGEEERHHARLASRAYQRAFLELLKEGTAAYDEVRTAEVSAKEADIRAKKALDAAKAADRAALRAECKWLPHKVVPREASADDGGEGGDLHDHPEDNDDEDELGRLGASNTKVLPPLPAKNTAPAKTTHNGKSKVKGTVSLFSSSSSAKSTTHGAAVPLEGVELAEHLRAIAGTAQQEASQLEVDAKTAHHNIVVAEAHAAARVASAREYLGHHEPVDWRVGARKKGGKHEDKGSAGSTGEHHTVEDDDAIARAVAKAEASVGGSMLDAGELDPEASFAAQVAGEREGVQEGEGGGRAKSKGKGNVDKSSKVQQNTHHKDGDSKHDDDENEGHDHEARAVSNHAEDCSQAQRGWLAWASDPHTWLCLARASRRTHLWPGAVDHAQAALDRLPPLPPPKHEARGVPPSLPQSSGGGGIAGVGPEGKAVRSSSYDTEREDAHEEGILRPFHSAPVAPEAKSRAEALFIQASSLAEMGQCDVAVACAGAALALYPKSQPVRRLIVSGLDLKLCAEADRIGLGFTDVLGSVDESGRKHKHRHHHKHYHHHHQQDEKHHHHSHASGKHTSSHHSSHGHHTHSNHRQSHHSPPHRHHRAKHHHASDHQGSPGEPICPNALKNEGHHHHQESSPDQHHSSHHHSKHHTSHHHSKHHHSGHHHSSHHHSSHHQSRSHHAEHQQSARDSHHHSKHHHSHHHSSHHSKHHHSSHYHSSRHNDNNTKSSFGQSNVQFKALPVDNDAIEEELEGDAWEEEADFADDLVDGCGFTDESNASGATPSATTVGQQPLGGTARGAAARRRECKLLAKAGRALRTLQARVRRIEIREGSARRGLNLVAQLCHKVHWRRDGRRALLLKHSARTIQRTWRDYNRYSADVAWRILHSPADSKYRKDLHGNAKKSTQLQEPNSATAKKKSTRFGGLADVVAQAKEKAFADENAEADAKEAAAKKLGFLAGERVEAKFGGMSIYFPAKVIRSSDKVPKAYMLRYDDGDVENAVPKALIRRPGEDHLPEDGDNDIDNSNGKNSQDVTDAGVDHTPVDTNDANVTSAEPLIPPEEKVASNVVEPDTLADKPQSTNVDISTETASDCVAVNSETAGSDLGAEKNLDDKDKSDESKLSDVFGFVSTKRLASSAWLTSIDLSAVPFDQRPTVANQLVVWETCAVRVQTRARMKLARKINIKRLDALERVGSYTLSLLTRLRLRACAELIGTLSSWYPLEQLESGIAAKSVKPMSSKAQSTDTSNAMSAPAAPAVTPEWAVVANEEINRLVKALNLSTATAAWWRSATSPFRRPLLPSSSSSSSVVPNGEGDPGYRNEQAAMMTSLRAARISALCGAHCGLRLSGGAATTPFDGFQPSPAKGLWWQRPGGFPGQAGFGGLGSELDKDPTRAPTAAAEASRLRATRALGATAATANHNTNNNTFTASNTGAAPQLLGMDDRHKNEGSNRYAYNSTTDNGAPSGTAKVNEIEYTDDDDASSEPGFGALAVVGSNQVLIQNFGPAPVVRALNCLRRAPPQMPALLLQEDTQQGQQQQQLQGGTMKGSVLTGELNPNSHAAAAAAIASVPRIWVPPLWAPLPTVLQLWSGATTHVIVTSPTFTAAAVRALARAIRLASQSPAASSSSVTSINQYNSSNSSGSTSSSSSSATQLPFGVDAAVSGQQDPTGGWQLEGSGADGLGWYRTLSILGNKNSSAGSLDSSSSSVNSVRALNIDGSNDDGIKGHGLLQEAQSSNLSFKQQPSSSVPLSPPSPSLAVTGAIPAATTFGTSSLAAAPVVGPASPLGKVESLHLSCRSLSCHGLVDLIELLLYPPRPHTGANGHQIHGVAAEANAAVEERRAYARSAAANVEANVEEVAVALAAGVSQTPYYPLVADATASPLRMVSPARKRGKMPQENDDEDEFSLALSPSLSSSSSSSSSSLVSGTSYETLFPTHFALAPGPPHPPAAFGTSVTRDVLPTNPSVRAATLHTLSLSGMALHANGARCIGRALLLPGSCLRTLRLDHLSPYGDVAIKPKISRRNRQNERRVDTGGEFGSGCRAPGQPWHYESRASNHLSGVVAALLPFVQRSASLEVLAIRHPVTPLFGDHYSGSAVGASTGSTKEGRSKSSSSSPLSRPGSRSLSPSHRRKGGNNNSREISHINGELLAVLCTALYVNSSLKRLLLDGNAISMAGTTQLLRASNARRARCVLQELSLTNQCILKEENKEETELEQDRASGLSGVPSHHESAATLNSKTSKLVISNAELYALADRSGGAYRIVLDTDRDGGGGPTMQKLAPVPPQGPENTATASALPAPESQNAPANTTPSSSRSDSKQLPKSTRESPRHSEASLPAVASPVSLTASPLSPKASPTSPSTSPKPSKSGVVTAPAEEGTYEDHGLVGPLAPTGPGAPGPPQLGARRALIVPMAPSERNCPPEKLSTVAAALEKSAANAVQSDAPLGQERVHVQSELDARLLPFEDDAAFDRAAADAVRNNQTQVFL